jgi:hypothetical protein
MKAEAPQVAQVTIHYDETEWAITRMLYQMHEQWLSAGKR